MDAVVMECRGSQAIVLKKDGTFAKVRNYDYLIGDEIQLSSGNMAWKKVALSAAACLILVAGIGTGLWRTPYSYIDVNAGYSVNYTLNRFDYVIDAVVDSDDEGIFTEECLKSMKNQKAEKVILESVKLADGEDDVKICVSSQSEEAQAHLLNTLESDEQLASENDRVKVEYGEEQDSDMIQASRGQEEIECPVEENTDEKVPANFNQNVMNEPVFAVGSSGMDETAGMIPGKEPIESEPIESKPVEPKPVESVKPESEKNEPENTIPDVIELEEIERKENSEKVTSGTDAEAKIVPESEPSASAGQ